MLLLFLPLAALADGMVIPTVAYPAKITIPDQRALICYTNGTERLVIETRFTGAGTNFAWVIPLPGQPVIEEATTGLFPTLQYLFRPEIIHDVPRYYLGILALIWLGYVLFFVRPTGRMNRLDVAACLLVVIGVNLGWLISSEQRGSEGWAWVIANLLVFADLMCVMLLVRFWEQFSSLTQAVLIVFLAIQLAAVVMLPTLGKARSMGSMGSTSSAETVSILDRKLVGIFETTTIASPDAKALQAWLSENGYVVPTNAEPVIASYVKDGWVFVATKVRRDRPDNETSTPHPLSFTFKTDKPVYPMRLTGVDNQHLSVELYVFSNARATAPHFKVERCTRPNYPAISSTDIFYWRHWSSEVPDIVHPLLRKWVDSLPVATKLVGTLSPADMRQDFWLDWSVFQEKKNHLYTFPGALTIALNWGAGIWAVCLLGAYFFSLSNETRRTKLANAVGGVSVCCIVLTGLIYFFQPKTEARLVKVPVGKMANALIGLGMEVSEEVTNQTPLANARITTANIIKIAQTKPYWDRRNDYLGGQIHEEDSPGNYTICETNGHLEFVSYDAEGAEHIEVLGQ